MIRQFELVEKLKVYDPNIDEELINKAYVFSMKAHGSQKRESGDPYFSHPLEVADILADLRVDGCSIATALLHDTVEDTSATLSEIKEHFGEDVARLVHGVSKLSKLELQSEATKQAENFKKLVLAMSGDIRVLLVKLADRLHNMRTLNFVKDELRKKRIARETLDIYAPLAERMGMHNIKDELEDLAFMQIKGEMHETITKRLKYLHKISENTIGDIINDLKTVVQSENIGCQISGRLKTPYSIWGKMQHKNISFEQLSDIMAFRIVVDNIPQCYQALGIVHSHYRVVPGRFKDYISTPKSNNYQSLHTGIIGPLNYRIEIQIRTTTMHNTAELGIAAHWEYKEGKKSHDGKQYAWLRSLLEILEHAAGPEEFLEHTKLEMFQDQVFCFTPKGELIALPKGATTIDFAYAIHSDIGDRAVGVKINGKQMPLRTILNNGDQVDIVTSNAQSPSPTWERFVVTGKARSRIRRFIRAQQREQFSELGKSILEKVCVKEGVTFDERLFKKCLKHFNCEHIEDLYAHVGDGILNAKDVLSTAYSQQIAASAQHKRQEIPEPSNIQKDQIHHPKDHNHSVSIHGLIPGMAMHFAGCCHPLPGDKIVGVVITGKGVTIHTKDCEGLSTVPQERIIDISWSDKLAQDERHVGRLKVTFSNRKGALASITSAMSKHDGNIVNLKITQRTSDFWDLLIDIEVKDAMHLNDVKGALRSIPLVTFVERI